MGARVRAYIPYDIPLGERGRARLALPEDLSEDEAERICGVIRTLAFSSEELAAAEAEAAAVLARRQGQARSLGALMADWAAADDPDESGQITTGPAAG